MIFVESETAIDVIQQHIDSGALVVYSHEMDSEELVKFSPVTVEWKTMILVKKCDYSAFLAYFKIWFSSLHNPNDDSSWIFEFGKLAQPVDGMFSQVGEKVTF